MSQRKMNYLPLLILPIILFLCFSVWTVQTNPYPSANVESDTGVYDMRGYDFSATHVQIAKTVEYVIGELLTPEEFAQRDDIRVGKVPDGTRVCTMRMRALVPEDMYYGVVGYSVNYASRVYINGKWIFDEGKPALTREEERSTEAYRLFSAEARDGVIEIVAATSAYSNIDSSSGMGWVFGEYESMRVYYIRRIASHIIVMGWYLIAAVVSLLLFFALPKYAANGWLALLGILWSVRVGLKGVKILLTLFPYFDWPFVYKVEILTCPLTIILFALILHSSFPNVFPKWLRYGLIGAAGAGVAVVLALPWYTFLGHSSVTNMLIYLTLAVMLPFMLFSMFRSRFQVAQVIILIGVLLSIFAFAWDADYFNHGFVPIAISQPMMLAFILFMTASALLATMQKTVEQEVILAQTVENQKRDLTEARISVMLSQIRPHFLYNYLTSIAMLCRKDPAQAERAIIDFSVFLRGNMDALTENKVIPFRKELEHIEVYLQLEKMRFGDDLNIVYDIQATDFSLPPLSVQPIVENAVKYGVAQKEEGGTVRIATRETRSCYLITVSDDGCGFDTGAMKADDRSHVGIDLVAQRLEAQCGGKLTIDSQPGKGTVATIEIPK